MAICVVIASAGRPSVLTALLRHLEAQDDIGFSVVVCVPDEASAPVVSGTSRIPLRIITGPRGASAQRNAALNTVPELINAVVFLDDDAVPVKSYIRDVKRVLDSNPSFVAFTGTVLLDGAQLGREVTDDEIRMTLSGHVSDESSSLQPVESLYGCNFIARMPEARTVSFDENLPLYSWLEDLDFSKRIQHLGTIGKSTGCAIIHIGSASGGRLQHTRFGFSQITNAVYLRNKNSIDMRKCLSLICRPLMRNILGALIGGSRTWRRQRLRGNILSITDLLRGRVSPDRIVSLE